jgi:hypothetical protein
MSAGIRSDSSGDKGHLQINGADVVTFSANFTKLQTGPTENRPSPAQAGMIRFNTTTGKFEGFNGSGWVDLS